MITEAVVQHGGRVVGERDDPALTVRGRGVGSRRDQRGRSRFVSAERLQEQAGVADRRDTGHV